MIKVLLGDKISNIGLWELSSHGKSFVLEVIFTTIYKQRTKIFIISHGIYMKMFCWCVFEKCHKTKYNKQIGSNDNYWHV